MRKYRGQEKISLASENNLALLSGMENASDIIDALGVKAIAKALDISEDAVRLARRQNKMPAAWFDTLETMAGFALPRDCFTFKGAA